MGGLGSLLGDEPPQRKVVPLDQGTKKLVDQMYGQAIDPNLGQKMTTGMEPMSEALLNSGKSAQQEAAGTGQNPAMLEAIRNQYKTQAQGGISRIMKQTNREIPFQRQQMLQSAGSGMNMLNEIEIKNQQALMEAQFNADMARAQVLQGIFGAGGMVIGAKMANSKGGQASENFKVPSESGTMLDSSGGHQRGEFDTSGGL